ncbi:hypothetical protein NDA13_000709 [Ustilago tritici]|nr:hypothetical protein NDA13_000709 [Ustilago tritici]
MVTQAKGQVTFEDELVTVQDCYGHAIEVPINNNGYPTAGMILWNDSMPTPVVSLAFTGTRHNETQLRKVNNKAILWHCRLGHPGHEAMLRTQSATTAHNIPLTQASQPDVLCDTCVQSKVTAKVNPHPHKVEHPLELVSMDIMGPLHESLQYSYVLIIHNTFSGMIWVRGLTNKAQAALEASWWVSETCQPTSATLALGIKEIRVDQGKLWTTSFHNLCTSSGIKITASPMQQHTDNAFAEHTIQTIQKIACCMLFDTNIGERWWPYAISQAAYVHNCLAGTTQGSKMPFKIFYAKIPDLHHVCHFSCTAYVMLCSNTRTTWLRNNPVDIHFSELKHPDESAPPSHVPVLSGNSKLLQSYNWLPTGDALPNSSDEDDPPPSLPSFSWQREDNPAANNDNKRDSYPEWDCTMSEIQDAGEIAIDMDAICADLNDQLDNTTAKGGISADLEASNGTSPLESPSLASMTNTPCHCPSHLV